MDYQEIAFKKPFMPPLDEFRVYLERIWTTRKLTNNGPVHSELELALCNYLNVKYISLFANGTTGLMIALKALHLEGEIITTPFTFAATAQAIYWNHLKPVFVDISEEDLNISVSAIENAITPRTTAILPVHIFGNPCQVDLIDHIASAFNLKVIYDNAHGFGVRIRDTPLCQYGDMSVLSFHATKVFSTLEGGAVVCRDETTKKLMDALKNNGLRHDQKLAGYGFNAKMNEIQSAYGLVHLRYVDQVVHRCKDLCMQYIKLLDGMDGIRLIIPPESVSPNYSYFPVLIDPAEFGATRDELSDFLKMRNIDTRKYFFPLISNAPEFQHPNTSSLPVANKMAQRILCLPLFYNMTEDEVERVAGSIIELHQKSG